LFKGGGLHVDSNRRIHKDVSLMRMEDYD
jgi:hypothetical protein